MQIKQIKMGLDELSEKKIIEKFFMFDGKNLMLIEYFLC